MSKILITQNKNQKGQNHILDSINFKILWWYPLFNHRNESRFSSFFDELNRNQNQNKKNKENINTNMNIIIDNIKNGKDKRTSLIIKNISRFKKKIDIIQWLNSLVKLNYIFIPKNEKTNLILGYAFINVYNYEDIIQFVYKIKKNGKYYTCRNKQIGICYYKSQGVRSLQKNFGESDFLFH